ncbi:MAG: hypothetical protein AAFQ82_11430 [Myxococcota bacterium]
MRVLTAIIIYFAATPGLAQTTDVTVPASHVPPSVLAELRALEDRFDAALAADCSVERCFSKGCIYGDHLVVDKPRSSSLPGLGEPVGPGSVQPQEYLTRARCEFTHEPSVRGKDVTSLINRLTQKLSKGWLTVTVKAQRLSPVPNYLSQAPPEPTPPVEKPAPQPEPAAEEPAQMDTAAPEWNSDVALRELWTSLLPHFSWMIAVVLLTIATLIVIWGLRRLGRESIEEKMLLQSLQSTPPDSPEPEQQNGSTEESLEAQRSRWLHRFGERDDESDHALKDLLKEWLRAREYGLLAKASALYSDRIVDDFPSNGELTEQKLEFAQYLRTLQDDDLPSDAEFFKRLNQDIVSSSLLAHEDAELHRSLREEVGPGAIAGLVESLPARHSALLFASAPSALRRESLDTLTHNQRITLAQELLESNRASRQDRDFVTSVIQSLRDRAELPRPPPPSGVQDQGQTFDAPTALSDLLPSFDHETRRALFSQAIQNAGVPQWYYDIVYPELVLRLPEETRADVLLEADATGLAAWTLQQPPQSRAELVQHLPGGLQNAVEQSMRSVPVEEIDSLADQSRKDLARGLKKAFAEGRAQFSDLVA